MIEAEIDASVLLVLGVPDVEGRKTWAVVDSSTLEFFGEAGADWADAIEDWVG